MGEAGEWRRHLPLGLRLDRVGGGVALVGALGAVLDDAGHGGALVVVTLGRERAVGEGEGEDVPAERGAAELAHLEPARVDVLELIGRQVLGGLGIGGLGLVLADRAQVRAVHRENVAVLVDASRGDASLCKVAVEEVSGGRRPVATSRRPATATATASASKVAHTTPTTAGLAAVQSSGFRAENGGGVGDLAKFAVRWAQIVARRVVLGVAKAEAVPAERLVCNAGARRSGRRQRVAARYIRLEVIVTVQGQLEPVQAVQRVSRARGRRLELDLRPCDEHLPELLHLARDFEKVGCAIGPAEVLGASGQLCRCLCSDFGRVGEQGEILDHLALLIGTHIEGEA